MTTLRLLFLLLFFNIGNCYTQNCNTDSLFNNFKNDIQIEERENAGVVTMDDETQLSFFLLLHNCPVQNLIKYTDDSNALIRSYIFVGLLRKGLSEDIMEQILEQHKNDTAKFTVQGGCVVMSWTVSGYMQFGAKLKSSNELTAFDYKSEMERLKHKNVTKLKVDGIRHGLVDKNELLKLDSLTFTTNEFKALSFTLYVGDQKFNSLNRNLTDEMKYAIEKAASGQIIYFADIQAVYKDNSIRYLNPVVLKLK